MITPLLFGVTPQPFLLLSDAKKKVTRAYRALIFFGRRVDRAIYVINRGGIIRNERRGTPAFSDVCRRS